VPSAPLRLDVLADPALDLRERHSGLAVPGQLASVVDDSEGTADPGHPKPEPLEGAGDAVGLGRLSAGHISAY
jgi:hypothetical protein